MHGSSVVTAAALLVHSPAHPCPLSPAPRRRWRGRRAAAQLSPFNQASVHAFATTPQEMERDGGAHEAGGCAAAQLLPIRHAPRPLAPQEMEKAARMMQEDMPLTLQDMQRTSKEFEILGARGAGRGRLAVGGRGGCVGLVASAPAACAAWSRGCRRVRGPG